jgi:hypothetical protein
MKILKLILPVILLNFTFNCAYANSELINKKFSLTSPHSKLFALKNKPTAWWSKYPNTECVAFSTHRDKKKEIGLICKSASQDFLNDVGIVLEKRNEEADQIRPLNVTVATAATTYPMTLFLDTKPPTLSAMVDCDESNAAIYRSTSSCHIAFQDLEDKSFLYSNFTIKNDQKKLTYISINDVKNLWEKLRTFR